MGNDHRLKVGAAEGPGVDERRVQKGLGTDYHRGYAPVFEGHGVVHTARGAGPSIGDGRDHEVTPLRQGIDDVLARRPGINELVQHQGVSKLELLVQQLLDAA